MVGSRHPPRAPISVSTRAQIARDLLGLDDDEIDRLLAAGRAGDDAASRLSATIPPRHGGAESGRVLSTGLQEERVAEDFEAATDREGNGRVSVPDASAQMSSSPASTVTAQSPG